MKKIDLSMYPKKYTDKLFELNLKMEFSLNDRNKLILDSEYQIIFLTPEVSKEFEKSLIKVIKRDIEKEINYDLKIRVNNVEDKRINKFKVKKTESELKDDLEMIKEHNIVSQL